MFRGQKTNCNKTKRNYLKSPIASTQNGLELHEGSLCRAGSFLSDSRPFLIFGAETIFTPKEKRGTALTVPNQNAPCGAEILVCSPVGGVCQPTGDSVFERERKRERRFLAFILACLS